MMKKSRGTGTSVLAAIVLLLALAVLLPPQALAAGASAELTADRAEQPSITDRTSATLAAGTGTVRIGDTVTITVRAEVQEMIAFELDVQYDSTRLRWTAAKASMDGYSTQPRAEGNRIVFAHAKLGQAEPERGNVTLATLSFKAIETGEASVVLNSLEVMDRRLVRAVVSAGASAVIAVSEHGDDSEWVDESGKQGNEVGKPTETNGGKAIGVTLVGLPVGKGERVYYLPARVIRMTTEKTGNVRAEINIHETVEALRSIVAGKGNAAYVFAIEDSAPAVELEVAADVIKAMQARQAAGGPSALIIASTIGSYRLPLDLLLSLRDGDSVRIVMEQSPNARALSIAAAELAEMGLQVSGLPVRYSISIADRKGGVFPLDFSGQSKITRSIAAGMIDPDGSAVVMITEDGAIWPVPVRFVARKDSGYDAILNQAGIGGGLYVVVSGSHSFEDMRAHWAEADVTRLAARLMVDGREESRFAPDESVTRAELAVLTTRILGLGSGLATGTGAEPFADVQQGEWYAYAVAVAAQFGLLEGYEDGMYGPERLVTREELAVVLSRVVDWIADRDAIEVTSIIDGYRDSYETSIWAKESVARMSRLGVFQGDDSLRLRPLEPVTRAETAVSMIRMLRQISFIEPS
ncbi:S-layer homology domain-containing protein [Paenibacillus sp. HWE-109]|uniref:S-layer homology domain-containing protein n=1 Tax=Paenibacillus sp. HWE-109 TaxID=1306526 RepID=UPI001EDFF1DA|nr:S-layer homology domain-containing protein [Paenibacillus sp. HWE-109]UKS29607.1 S-layer homology domain-containing protein [Paenibacillus sp. HWE-109]